MKNDVWEVVPRPKGMSIMTSKWIYKIKHVATESIEKYKAKFVAHGFSQKEGIDYDEFMKPLLQLPDTPPSKQLSPLLLSLDGNFTKWIFFNGKVEEEVYIEQPKGFVTHGMKSHVCKLNKALYGLK